ncbi:MAG: CTP synthase [archaeon]
MSAAKQVSSGSKTRFVFVFGGVISGVGKGIVSASIAALLKARGHSVSSIKVDPYINVDAGTMRPTEHGEVFVTEDGGETDEDLGHYERFSGETIPKANNITTGQIFKTVIEAERAGKYLGKTVMPIPQVVDEIVFRIRAASNGKEICIVEVGGVVGDYENVLFVHATQKIAMQEGRERCCNILVVYMPVPSHIGEMKSKPAQHAITAISSLGAFPDFLVVRASQAVDEVRKEKISSSTNIAAANIVSCPNVPNVYGVPLLLERQGFLGKILAKIGIAEKAPDLGKWKSVLASMDRPKRKVKIAMIAKYIESGSFRLADSYVSISEALRHAGAHLGVGVELSWIDSKKYEQNTSTLSELSGFDGVMGLPGFGNAGVEGKILAIRFARERKIPYLGICYGMQLALVEIARDVCKLRKAHTTECESETVDPIVMILPGQTENISKGRMGGTLRLGSHPAILGKGTLVRKIYNGAERIEERHRHRYEVNLAYRSQLERAGVVFSGTSPDGRLMEFMELKSHPFFVGTQAHPEYKSRFLSPSPLYLGFIKACVGAKQLFTSGKQAQSR